MAQRTMADRFDQIFVDLKHALVNGCPAALQPWVSILLSIVPILLVFCGLFAITTVAERKGLGRIQNRLGPNRVGLPPLPLLPRWLRRWRLAGFGQAIADGIKVLVKEDV